MRYMGVDPGLGGAIAVLDQAGHVELLAPTPTSDNDKGRQEYNLAAIAKLLCATAAAGELLVTVEKLQGLPPTRTTPEGEVKPLGGFLTNVHRGEARGWAWMIAGLAATGLPITCELVAPKEWQKELVKGFPAPSHKDRSVAVASRIFPGVPLYRTERSRKEDDGMAEALLLAELGRRRSLGGALFAQRS